MYYHIINVDDTMWTVINFDEYNAFDVDKVYCNVYTCLFEHVHNIAKYAREHSDVSSYALDDTNGMTSDFTNCINECMPTVLASMTSDTITKVVHELLIATRSAVYCTLLHATTGYIYADFKSQKSIPAGVLKAVLDKGHGVQLLKQMHQINAAVVVIQRKWKCRKVNTMPCKST